MAKPKLALIPAAQGSKFYSVLPSSGVGDFDFTRSGSATRINAQGLIESVANGVSRLNYPMIDGVVKGCPHHILEPERLNRIPNSDEFSGSETNVSVSRNQVISPDGTLNADRVLDNNNNGEHLITGSYSGSITSGLDYTASVFFKSDGTGGKGVIRFYLGAWNNAVFNLDDGTISYTSSGVSKIENYGNGWYRCSLKFTAASDYGNTIIQLAIANSSNQFSYQGTSSLGNYFWGVQFEQGSYPTSYIPTNGSAVTRSAETAFGSGDASTFNDSEGVLMAEISALANDLTNRYILLGTTSNNVYIRYQNSSNSLRCNVTVNGSSQFIAIFNLDDETINSKISVKYKENDFSLYVNGFKLKTDLGGSTFTNGTLTELAFDNGLSNQFPFYGNIKQLQYFDTVLNDNELETLTSWVSFSDMAEGQLYTIE
jgi:hypothetical protein